MTLDRNYRNKWGQILLLAACGILACLPTVGWAQVNYYWNGASGIQDWGNPANWNPTGGPAVNGDNAFLYPPNNFNYIVNYNTQAPNLAGVFINGGFSNSMTLLLGQTGLALQADVVSVGGKVQGMLQQTAGILKVQEYLYVGNTFGGTGTYTMTGGVLEATNSYVGYSGTGTFDQSGGTHTVSTHLGLGRESTGTGTYNLTNGSLETAETLVGWGGTGTFTQSGGTHTVATALHLGYTGGSNGTYNLENGSVNPQLLFVGYNGTGAFNQNGGSVTINDHLGVGREDGSIGELQFKRRDFHHARSLCRLCWHRHL